MIPTAYILWNVSPECFTLGPIVVRWYGLLFALSFLIGAVIVHWQYHVEHKDRKDLDWLLICMILGTAIGARLGHVLFYEPEYYFAHPLEIPQFWEGGLASHGAAVGVLITLYLYTRKRPDQPFVWLLDRLAVSAALAACFIRLGNLFNSEILGSPSHVPWAFVFEKVSALPRHPVQLYESVVYAAVFVLQFVVYWRLRERTPRGLLLGLFLVIVFSARFVLEFFKERLATYEQNFPLSVGQLLSIPFVVFGVFLLWRAMRRERV